jgi:hypothetical protein
MKYSNSNQPTKRITRHRSTIRQISAMNHTVSGGAIKFKETDVERYYLRLNGKYDNSCAIFTINLADIQL